MSDDHSSILPYREGQRVLIEAEFVKEIDYVNDDGPGYVPGVILMVAGKTVCVRADALSTEQSFTPSKDDSLAFQVAAQMYPTGASPTQLARISVTLALAAKISPPVQAQPQDDRGPHRCYTPAGQSEKWKACRCDWGADHGDDGDDATVQANDEQPEHTVRYCAGDRTDADCIDGLGCACKCHWKWNLTVDGLLRFMEFYKDGYAVVDAAMRARIGWPE